MCNLLINYLSVSGFCYLLYGQPEMPSVSELSQPIKYYEVIETKRTCNTNLALNPILPMQNMYSVNSVNEKKLAPLPEVICQTKLYKECEKQASQGDYNNHLWYKTDQF